MKSHDTLRVLCEDLQETMWPKDDLDAEWSADTLDEIARLLANEGFGRTRVPDDEAGLTLHIETGNAAMRTRAHLADALEMIAIKLRAGNDEGKVRDVNGNTVGAWAFRK